MSAYTEHQHRDLLNELNKKTRISNKVGFLHQVVKKQFPMVHRIGVAVYDQATDTVNSFTHSTDGDNPLPHYQCKLQDSGSLYHIYLKGKPRLIHDLSLSGTRKEHTRRLLEHGFRSSYTMPTYHNGNLMGFVFFNSREPHAFQEECLAYLDMIARLVSLLISVEVQQMQTLYGALKMATSFSGHRDPETGAHLERMARFSRLIAHEVAGTYRLSDEFVESIYWLAPMHDVGKIAIPDHILLKPGKLTPEEFEVMKTHSSKGRELVNTMLGNFQLDKTGMASMIGNIAEFHHENIDGSGYPRGLQGDDIPLEARIVAVADVFDALTSKRCYKPAWSNVDAFEALRAMSTWKLEPLCVEALCRNLDKIQEIQALFKDDAEPAENQPNLWLPQQVWSGGQTMLDAVK